MSTTSVLKDVAAIDNRSGAACCRVVSGHRRQPLLPRPAFLCQLLRHAGGAVLLIAASPGVGAAGNRFIARTSIHQLRV